MTEVITIDDVVSDTDIAKCISTQLTSEDPKKTASGYKSWRKAINDVENDNRLALTIKYLTDILKDNATKYKIDKASVTADLSGQIQRKILKNHIRQNHEQTTDVNINGWARDVSLPDEIYDLLFNTPLKKSAKYLTLRGRGTWSTCYCPEEGSKFGEQVDTINEDDITNLEYIYVGPTFTISSCALLDLISKSPKLKILRFYGMICNHNHHEIFKSKRFLSDLDQVFWPFPKKKKQVPTLSIIVKRNENLTTLYTSSEVICDLLAAEALNNLRYLSMNLNENWTCDAGNVKKARGHLERLQYLSLAKNIEALEIRTFMDNEHFSECSETNLKAEHLYENYKLSFWTQVARWQKLRYLGVYGAWQLEDTCREMVKHGLQVEYLKISLMPSTIMASVDAGDDNPILAMEAAARNLRKLSRLRSLYFVCFEKLASIDRETSGALKELIDLFWVVDIKTGLTDEVEDLLSSVAKRANQSGKMFKIKLYIQPQDEKSAGILATTTLRFPIGTISIRDRLMSLAEDELTKRQIKGSCKTPFVWGLEQIEGGRDKESYGYLSRHWQSYQDKFALSSALE